MAKDKEFTSEVIKKIHVKKVGENNADIIQVIKWGDLPPVLEKRQYYKDAEGNKKPGKLKGLNKEDFKLIFSQAKEIYSLL